MTSTRLERVQRQLLRETSVVLKEEMKDPRIGFVTVTEAQLSPDFRHAKIFVSILGSRDEQEETFQVLQKASGFVRAQIGQRIRLRYTPEITFMRDDSIEHVDRIFRIMNEIKTKESHNNAS